MKKEVLAGIAVALIVFLVFKGVEVAPIIAIVLLGAVVFYSYHRRGLHTTLTTVSNSSVPQLTFADIGGQGVAKKELQEALAFIINEKALQRLGIRPLKGILLCGPPGTGKTLLAKAAAHSCDAAFLATSGSNFIEMYAGVGAQRVRSLFSRARSMAKALGKKTAVIFIDELEVIGGIRGRTSNHQEYDQTLNQLLVEMDGISTDDAVRILVIAATNRKDMLDPALLRPGRFDRIVQVDLPDKEGRLEILKLHTKNKPLADDVNLKRIAEDTFGFSGAHLESVCNEAAIMALRDQETLIRHCHFESAVEKVLMGEKLNRSLQAAERERVAVHEAGHALVCELLSPGSVATVNITSRGKALGYMRQKQSGDSYLLTKEQLERQIKIALGGCAAEQVVYGYHSTGAQNDFEKAHELAEMLIAGGMTEAGVVNFKKMGDNAIAVETSRIVNHLLESTVELLRLHQKELQAVAQALKENETISGEQIRQLVLIA